MRKIFFLIFIVGLVFTACKKADFDKTVTGEAVGTLTLISPGADSVLLNPATPNATFKFQWTAAAPGVNSAVKYRLVAAQRSAENFETVNRVLTVPSDNNGSATTLTLTYKQIDDLLKASSIGSAQRAELKWTIEAFNDKEGSSLASSSNVIIFKRATNGTAPFHILGPTNASILAINPQATLDSIKFNWTGSTPAAGSPAVNYVVRFYDGNVEGTPVFTMRSNRLGVDTFRAISHKDMADTLIKYGLSAKADLKWNVVAVSGTWNEKSDYSNNVTISRLIPYTYPQALNVAGNYQGWSPSTAPQLVSMANNGEYEGYIFFNQVPEFKIVKGNDWSAGDFGSPGVPTLTNGGDNIKLPSGGHYRLNVNTSTMTWNFTKIENWGVVGSATPGGWDNDTNMAYNASTGSWEITLTLTAGELKFRANDGWDINFGDNGANGSLEYGGANIPIASNGTYKVTLDLNYGGNWSYAVKKL